MQVQSSLGIVSWIIFGAIAGWAAGKLAGEGDEGCLTNIIVGIVGAFVGGFLFSFVTGRQVLLGFDPGSFVIAVIGSLVLLTGLRLVRNG